jgi:hypothetical protein
MEYNIERPEWDALCRKLAVDGIFLREYLQPQQIPRGIISLSLSGVNLEVP